MSALLTLGALLAPQAAFVETVVPVPMDDGRCLALRDLTGDGRLDLVRVDEEGLAVFPLGDDGKYAEEAATSLSWPVGRVGWDLSDIDGDGVSEVAIAEASEGVRLFRVGEDGFDDGALVLESTSYLSWGVDRVRFARDVDGDGKQDLVLPGSGAHRIFLARESGWAEPIEVTYELRTRYEVGDPESLSSTFGQRVRIPWFEIEDIDGDGRNDLVARTSDRIAFHLAAPELKSEPTWVLDLEALRGELPERDGIDFDNLFALLDDRVTWKIAELDGRPPSDLIVILGSKFRMYLGGAATGPIGDPDQVLKSSGNVLWSFVRQAEGDPLPDLQIARGQRISVARILRSILLPSSLDFDLFTYRNEGGTFSRRPTRRNTVTFEIPRLLAFMDDSDSLEQKIEDQFEIRARRLARAADAPAVGDDVIDVAGDELVVYAGCAPAPMFMEDVVGGEFDAEMFVESFFLTDFDERGDGASRVLDIGDMDTYEFAPGALLRRAYKGMEPALTHPLATEGGMVSELIARDLDGDGRTDVITIGERDEEWVVQFLVRAGS